jgi:hypothetical protein
MKLDHYLMLEYIRVRDYDAMVSCISQHFGLGLSEPVQHQHTYTYDVNCRELRLTLPEGTYSWLEDTGFKHWAGGVNLASAPHVTIWPCKKVT